MFRSQQLLSHCQTPSIQGFRLDQLALAIQESCHLIHQSQHPFILRLHIHKLHGSVAQPFTQTRTNGTIYTVKTALTGLSHNTMNFFQIVFAKCFTILSFHTHNNFDHFIKVIKQHSFQFHTSSRWHHDSKFTPRINRTKYFPYAPCSC